MYIFQDTKIEDIPPIILQANFYLILGLAPQQKYVYMYVYYIYMATYDSGVNHHISALSLVTAYSDPCLGL